MRNAIGRVRLWIGVSVLLLAGCGGGGGDAPSDARNGDYAVFAANGRQYTLSLNFDAKTYRMSGNAVDVSGTMGTVGSSFAFAPAAAASANTARFAQANDAVIGGFSFDGGVIPFVAPRSFVTTVADAVGTYNFLITTVDTAAAANNAIFAGEITADGQLRTCHDNIIYTIALCPAASVTTGTLTVSGSDFVSTTASGAFNFRIARMGTDKVFVRASPSSATARAFWVGTVVTPSYASGTFTGATTLGEWSVSSVTSSTYSATALTPSGSAVARAGTATLLSASPSSVSPGGILRLSTVDRGDFFSIRAANLGMVVAARDSTAAPGFVEIGKP